METPAQYNTDTPATAPQTEVRMNTFTPIFDAVVQDVGLVGASVYGRIWRYCQGNRSCCDAAQATIAESLNISTRTVMRWAKDLCDKGYLKDLTPDLRNKPHTYVIASKLRLVVEVRAECDGVTESPPTMTESHTHYDRKSQEETSNRQEERDKSTATPSTGVDIPPSSLNAWLDKLKEPNCNRTAVLRWMISIHFPDIPEADLPSFGKVGKVAKRLHAGYLAQLIWVHSGKRITGCPLDYLQAVAKGTNRDNGSEPKGQLSQEQQSDISKVIARKNLETAKRFGFEHLLAGAGGE